MSDFDATKIKVIFIDIGGVLLSNGWGHSCARKQHKFLIIKKWKLLKLPPINVFILMTEQC